jgi:rod shape determining protein RodA
MRALEDLDRLFVFNLLFLLLTGLLVVYSACQADDPSASSDLWRKQIVFACVGVFGFLVCAALPHMLWYRVAPVIYVVSIALLVAVFGVGQEAGGAMRWIEIAGVRFQPSELAKPATAMLLARELASRKHPPNSIPALLRPLLIVLAPTVLVLRQPDLGTALVFLIVIPPMLFWTGSSLSYLVFVATPILAVFCAFNHLSWIGFLLFLFVLARYSRTFLLEKGVIVFLSIVTGFVTPKLWDRLEPYQQERMRAFLHPPGHPGAPPAEAEQRKEWREEMAAYRKYISGSGYQIIQSRLAVGSGGLSGMGFLQGPQKRLAFLPARHTDFIFSVVGEEFGFLGTMTVLGLFSLLIARGFRIAASARDPFASSMTVAIMSMFAFQVLVNIGVALGLMPVTGFPLPIYSYGGTSLISTLGALGIVVGVGLRRRI